MNYMCSLNFFNHPIPNFWLPVQYCDCPWSMVIMTHSWVESSRRKDGSQNVIYSFPFFNLSMNRSWVRILSHKKFFANLTSHFVRPAARKNRTQFFLFAVVTDIWFQNITWYILSSYWKTNTRNIKKSF